MAYTRLGLGALVVSALRAAVADPAVQDQVDEQARAIATVRENFDALTGRLDTLAATVESNGTLDADQAEELRGIKGELSDLATALAGPADDTTDNGVLAEVAPVADETSAAADAIVDNEAAVSGSGEQGGTGSGEQGGTGSE